MTNRFHSRRLALAVLAGLALPSAVHALPASSPRPLIADASEAVYTATNGVTRNQVVAYRRAATGALSFLGTFPTGGRGSGEISAFEVGSGGRLSLVGTAPNGGGFPVGLVYGDLLYVLNSGGPAA